MDHKCEAITCVANNRYLFKSSFEVEWKHNWPDGELSYRLNNFSEDTKAKWQIAAVTESLMAWQLLINKIKFRREHNMDSHVDFNVSFKPQSNFNSEDVLAQCYFPGQGEVSGDCEINDAWDWVPGISTSNSTHPPMVPILIHEFGHGLGLIHDSDHLEDIMFPSFSLFGKKNTIGPYSTKRIQARYGTRTLGQHVMDVFLQRRNLGTNFR